MRHPLLLLIIAGAGALAQLIPLPARADSSDPSEAFLNAYLSVQAADKLEADGSYKAALAKYRYAGSLLDQLHERHPEWQPLIVDYRKKKTTDAIAKLEGKLALEAPPAPASSASPAPALDLGSFPSVPEASATPQAAPRAARPATDSNSQGGNDIVDQAAKQIREQMATLKRELQQSHDQLEAVQKEKAAVADQLGSALDKLNKSAAANRQQTNAQEDLKAQLEQAKAAGAQAKAQLERATVSETALQAGLEKAQEELKKAKNGKTAQTAATEAADKQIAQLRNALDDARADREVAEEQGEILAKRVAKLSEAGRKTKQELELSQADKAKVAGSLAEAEKKLVAMVQERDAAKSQTAQLSSQLAESKKQIVAVTSERDTANKQRDDALVQVAKAKEAKVQVEKLLAENGDLMKKLDGAQKAISGFNSAAPEKDKEIGALKATIAGVQGQLAAAQKESANDKNYIVELQAQLDSTNVEPQGPALPVPEEQKKLSDENRLLHGIVMRELKGQARQEQFRKLMVSELNRLQVRSRALNDLVDLVSQPVVKLTEEERALFKTPQMEIIDNESSSTAISIAAPESAAVGTGSASTPNTGSSGTAGSLTPASRGRVSPIGGVGAASAADSRAGDTEKAVGSTESKPGVPAEFQALAQEAKDKLDRKQYVEAERDYEKLISKLPTNLYALSNLGVAQFRAGQVKSAEETFKKVIAISPNDSFAYSTLGILYYGQKKYDEAVDAFTRSLASNPKNATAHNYLGVTAAQKGWEEAAQKEIETAVQLDPAYGEAHFNLAVVLTRAQPPDMENARKHYQRALELGAERDPKLEESLK